MKKILSVVLSLAMLLSLLAVPAMAEDTINIIWYNTEDTYKSNVAANPDAFDPVWSVIPEFEAATGVKVNVIAVEWGDMINTAATRVGNGEPVDLVQANDQSFPVYPARKIVQPIAQYLDLSKDCFYDSVTNAFTFGGQAYAAGNDVSPLVMYYNVDMFEANGVDLPRDLYEAGEWTWENFRRVAKELTADTDNDGEEDQFGFGYWDTDYVSFLASNGTSNLIYNEDGTISTGYLTEAGTQTMTFLQECYTVDKCMWPNSGDDTFTSGWSNGKLAMTLEFAYAILNNAANGTLPFEVDWVPMPQGPSGAGDTCLAGVTGWCIGITSALPEAAAKFIEMSAEMKLASDNKVNVERYGEANVTKMNELAGKAHFVPIGIDQYWDNNYTVFTGLRSNEPVVNFLTKAEEQIKAGYESTMSN
ncbi:MAG: extracellular solute-binding protein [Clostridiales bacterium]|nr:extracellular solute-binding protein [Clostridiales bacterium]